MVKILFLMDNITEGGAEKVLRNLVNNMDQEQFQITVQTLDNADAPRYLVPGIRYKAINRRKTPFGKKLFSYWIRLCAQLNWIYPLYIKDDYDIEVAYLECGPTKFLSGSTNHNALKLAWVHCDLEKKGIVATKKLRKIYSRFDQVVCVSNNVRDSFLKLFPNVCKTTVLYNVNDEEQILSLSREFVPQRPEKFTFLAIGRLSHQKGFDRLLDACCILQQNGLQFHLQILGEGPERSALETQIQMLHLEDSVELLGFQSNPYPYMLAADCIVCTSRYEGFSTVVTEALILGKPIISTPCTGMDELLGNSEYGLIVDDCIDGIYGGMKTMLLDTHSLHHFCSASAYRGLSFSKRHVLNKTQHFFASEFSKKNSSG